MRGQTGAGPLVLRVICRRIMGPSGGGGAMPTRVDPQKRGTLGELPDPVLFLRQVHS